jgi:hypothetical protein
MAALTAHTAEAEVPGLEGIPEIVAEVNDHPIKRMELVRELVGASGTKALERLVHRILIEQAAAEQKIIVTDQDIETQYKLDKNDLADDLVNVERDPKKPVPMEETVRSKFGISIPEYKNTVIRQRLLARRLMASDINPDEHELRKFYETYPDLFQEPIRFRAAHILITPLDPRDLSRGGQTKSTIGQMLEFERMREARQNFYKDNNIAFKDSPTEELSDAWRESKIQAERLSQELQAYPQRWNDYVKRFSRDPADQVTPRKVGDKSPIQSPRQKRGFLPGEVGWYHKYGPMVREFYDGTKNIKVGQIAGPIKTQFGWHIVKMLDTRFPPVLTFAQAKEKVRRLYIENEIQLRSDSWLVSLAARAELKTEKATLWPTKPQTESLQIGIDISGDREAQEADPVVGRVNGVPIKRSEVWRDLLRSEGEEALTRLINREVVMTILKDKGVAFMEWLCSSPEHRSPNAPRAQPIRIKEESMQRELNDDRVEYDKLIHENKVYANLSFNDFLFQKFGQPEADYRRAIEASLILRSAIKQKLVPNDERDWERTLKFEFAMARDQYSQSEWFEIAHILIVPTGGMLRMDKEAQLTARMIADKIYQQFLARPEAWAELVDMYSDDTPENKARHGLLSGCYADRNPPDVPESEQFYNEIQTEKLEAGMATPPQRSARGFHIVRLIRKHKAQQADYEEKRKQVEQDYINEKAKFYADVWVRALNNRAIVKHYLYKPTLAFEEGDAISIPDNFKPPKD